MAPASRPASSTAVMARASVHQTGDSASTAATRTTGPPRPALGRTVALRAKPEPAHWRCTTEQQPHPRRIHPQLGTTGVEPGQQRLAIRRLRGEGDDVLGHWLLPGTRDERRRQVSVPTGQLFQVVQGRRLPRSVLSDHTDPRPSRALGQPVQRRKRGQPMSVCFSQAQQPCRSRVECLVSGCGPRYMTGRGIADGSPDKVERPPVPLNGEVPDRVLGDLLIIVLGLRNAGVQQACPVEPFERPPGIVVGGTFAPQVLETSLARCRVTVLVARCGRTAEQCRAVSRCPAGRRQAWVRSPRTPRAALGRVCPSSATRRSTSPASPRAGCRPRPPSGWRTASPRGT